MKRPVDVSVGAHCLPNGIRYVDLWIEIHRLAEKHAKSLPHDAKVFDALTLELLNDLSSVDATKWRALCRGIGFTVYGAVAMSWCKNAQLSEVLEDWCLSGVTFSPGFYNERPARFVNPALLPHEASLKRIVELSESNQFLTCVMIAASKFPLQFDLPFHVLNKAPINIAAFLREQIRRREFRTDGEKILESLWTELLEDMNA